MSGDGPTKLAPPEAEPLDDIILGDDDATVVSSPPAAPAPPAPIVKSVSSPPAALGPSADEAAKAAAEAKEKERKRQKLTLRIPDDEVSRPTLPSSNSTPSAQAARPASIPDDGPSAPRRASADDTLELPARAIAGVDTSEERGWTPYQPPVAENGGRAMPVAAKTLIDEPSVEPPIEPPPPSEDIPIDTDITGEHDAIDGAAVDHEAETMPRLPLMLDSEEIKIDEGDRGTDPGEVAEVAPEDLVSVESIPNPPPPPAKGVAAPAVASAPHPPAQSTPQPPLAAAPPPAAAAAPPAAAAAPPAAAAAPPPAAAAAPPAAAAAPPPAPKPATGPQLQRPVTQPQAIQIRPTATGGVAIEAQPIVFVAPVGALAPPPMNEAAIANKKKVRPWWEELFNDDYIRTMAKVTDAQIGAEVSFIEESLACERGAMILDLACGTGRHAVELARRGYQVVGYDLSLSMLARASDEAQERGQKINFVQGDMREMTFDETFDGIFTWNTSFGFFDEEKNGAVVARVHRALKKGGQFLLDVVNRDYIVRQAPSLAWFEGEGCICMDEMQIDFITSRMKVKRTLMMDDGRTKEIEYSIRLYSLHELGKLLHDNGFRVAEVSGRTGTPGVFFGCESPRTLILAEKR